MIDIKNLSFTYNKGTGHEIKALLDINLHIAPGTVTAVAGHTGSGKSTLIQAMDMLITPDKGNIIIDGIDITDKKTDLRLIRRKVGIVFQYPENQLFEESVYKDIAFAPKNMGIKGDELRECVNKAAIDAGMDLSLLDKSPFELSGGQKRRAAIAGVLAMEPSVLILDEPTAGLDPRGRNKILSMIKQLHEKNKNMIIIFVTHSMEDIIAAADNVIIMKEGHILKHCPVSEVFSDREVLNSAGLALPQIMQITDRLRNCGIPLENNVYTPSSAAAAIEKLLSAHRKD